MSAHTRQLLTYDFPPGTEFQGRLVGALERIESGGAMRVLDALFVGRDPESGDLIAVSLSVDGRAGMTGQLLSFRLDDAARKKSTQKVLNSPSGAIVQALGEKLEPGAAVGAVLVEHSWALLIADAIGRVGGSQTNSQFVRSRGARRRVE